MVLLGYSGARGTLIYEKNLKPKISCQTPFKAFYKCTVPTLRQLVAARRLDEEHLRFEDDILMTLSL
jgi:hypothetical protein